MVEQGDTVCCSDPRQKAIFVKIFYQLMIFVPAASQYSYQIYTRPEAASDVIFGKSVTQCVAQKVVKFDDPGLNYSR